MLQPQLAPVTVLPKLHGDDEELKMLMTILMMKPVMSLKLSFVIFVLLLLLPLSLY